VNVKNKRTRCQRNVAIALFPRITSQKRVQIQACNNATQSNSLISLSNVQKRALFQKNFSETPMISPSFSSMFHKTVFVFHICMQTKLSSYTVCYNFGRLGSAESLCQIALPNNVVVLRSNMLYREWPPCTHYMLIGSSSPVICDNCNNILSLLLAYSNCNYHIEQKLPRW